MFDIADKQMDDCEVKLPARPPVCSDFDDDCDIIADKVHCWLYDPAKGRCPYLSRNET